MAVEDFKAADKGIKVEIVSADHQNKPDVGSNIARQWYDQDGVDVIVDVPTSSVALAVNQITREKNKVFINSGAASSDLTGKACSPNTVHWTYDTCRLANGTGGAMVKAGRRHLVLPHRRLRLRPRARARHRGGRDQERRQGARRRCATRSRAPDFSSFLLQAQASRRKVIGLANAGGDTINSIKQAAEFGITQGGQKLAGLLVFITRRPRARPPDRAGAGADRGLLLGPERPHPRLVEALRREAAAARCRPWCRPASMSACCTT